MKLILITLLAFAGSLPAKEPATKLKNACTYWKHALEADINANIDYRTIDTWSDKLKHDQEEFARAVRAWLAATN